MHGYTTDNARWPTASGANNTLLSRKSYVVSTHLNRLIEHICQVATVFGFIYIRKCNTGR